MTDTDGDGKHDVILEKDDSGNTYLHLVMPASAVNFLNGSDGSSLFNFSSGGSNGQAQQQQQDTNGDEVFIEVGCKVYEVNKVNYRGRNERQLSTGSASLWSIHIRLHRVISRNTQLYGWYY